MSVTRYIVTQAFGLAAILMLGVLAGSTARAAEEPEFRVEARDFAAGQEFRPLEMKRVPPRAAGLYRGESREMGLSLDVEVAPQEDRTLYGGVLRDLRGKDRALTLRLALPLDAVGWLWWDDLGTSRPIEEGKLYERVQSWGAGRRTLSVYPLCALAGKERGVGAALDPGDPRCYRLRYDAGSKALRVELDLGLSPVTKTPGEADFAFTQFTFDARGGFRAALQRTYDLFPAFARRRAAEEGIWLLGFDPAVMANPWDYGLKFDEGAQYYAGYDTAHGIEPYVYTEPWGRYRGFGKRPTPDGKPRYGEKAPFLPVPELVESILSEKNYVGPEGRFDETRRRWATALEHSAITDAAGGWIFRHWTDEWSKDNWLSNVTCNPDPDLPQPNRATMTWSDELWPAFRAAEASGGALKGVYLDSVSGFMGFNNENFRRDHWRHADIPLVPSEATGGPAQLHAFACVEFARQVAEEMWLRNLLVIANTERPYMQFFCPLVDMIGAGETKMCGLADDERYRYLRTYAGTKPVSWMDYSFVNPKVPWEQKERGMKRCLHYAVHPGTGPFRERDAFERSRPLFRRYEPLIIRLGRAGWQPVTGAHVEAGDAPSPVLVERYGSDADSVYFSLRNPTAEARSGELVASLPAALTKARDRLVCDALTGAPVKGVGFDSRGARTRVPFSLAADETAVFRVTRRSRLVRDALADAALWLGRFQAEARWIGRATGGLLTNGGFEEGAGGWGKEARSAEVTIIEADALAGKRSLRVTAQGKDAHAAPHQNVALRGGVPYVLSFTYRWTRPEGAAGTVVPRLGVKDAAGKWLSGDYIHINDLRPTDGKAARFEREVTPAAATAGGFFQFLCGGDFGTFEVDDVMLRAVAEQTPAEAVAKALAAVAASGAEERLKASVEKPDRALEPASQAVAALTSAFQGVEAAVRDEHTRRCLALPLQAAALAASGAVEAAAGIHVSVPLFPTAVSGQETRVLLVMERAAGNPDQPWSARVPGAKTAATSRNGNAEVGVSLPEECPWGWHDALIAIEAPAGRERVHLLKRVTLRAQPALSLAPVSPVVSSLDGTLRLAASNRSNREAAGIVRLEATRPDGQPLRAETDLRVAAGGEGEVRMAPAPSYLGATTLRAKAVWAAGDRSATWEGDIVSVPGANCPSVGEAPTLDGSLEDAAWQRAAEVSPFVKNTEPVPPAKKTTVRVCRDAACLYVAFTCHGPTAGLAASRTQRDGELWLDDSVEVFLDPAGRRQEYYQFVVNAAGAQYDAQCGPGGMQAAWNADWKARVGKSGDAWTVEMAIPFAALHAAPTGSWAANFCRHDAATGEASAWACLFGGFHTPARFGELRF